MFHRHLEFTISSLNLLLLLTPAVMEKALPSSQGPKPEHCGFLLDFSISRIRVPLVPSLCQALGVCLLGITCCSLSSPHALVQAATVTYLMTSHHDCLPLPTLPHTSAPRVISRKTLPSFPGPPELSGSLMLATFGPFAL